VYGGGGWYGHLQLVTLACGPGLGCDPHGTLLNVPSLPKRNKMHKWES
jgi:hypothetical protein